MQSLHPHCRAPGWFSHRRDCSCPAAAATRWQRRQRLARAVRVWAGELPTVDWTRRSLQQILFVDRTDTVRARFAVGMLERVASWVGCSRAVQAYPCGIDAEPGSRISWSTQASLFSLADSWKLRLHLFTAARQQFDDDDVDRFELIVCLDSGIQAQVLKLMSAARPTQPASYVSRICCLTDFLMYCPDEALMQQGSSALLDKQLRGLVRLALPGLRPSPAKVAAAAAAGGAGAVGAAAADASAAAAVAAAAAVPSYMLPTGIQRPALHGCGGSTASQDDDAPGSSDGGSSSGSGGAGDRWEQAEQWDRMALLMVVCCAGLVQYLLDCRSDDPTD